MRAPRKQAHHIAEWLTRDKPSLHAVVVGARRSGKSDLLAQLHQLLFERAEGPLPFWFRFEILLQGDTRGQARQALRFAAAFCHQIRAFLLRQEELLAETPGDLSAELDRPGLPLALSELAHELLTAYQRDAAANQPSADALVSMAARLPARFAHREGRPVCHLWDDCHLLDAGSAYLSALESAGGVEAKPSPVCALITGLAPQMRALIGQRSLTALELQPFTVSEALLMAESSCKGSGIRFNREVWEQWFAVAGTSPGWAAPLIERAGLEGEPIESIEQLGRLYAAQLESGSMGLWLAERWPLPAPARPADDLAPQAVAEMLGNHHAGLLAVDASETHSSRKGVAASLDRQEWLRLRSFAAENSLSPVEADWLLLETDRATMGSARAKARLLQDFLRRVRNLAVSSQESGNELSLDAIEEHLLYPPSPGAAISTASGDTVCLPEISSVVRESSADGELFWCFGEATLAAKPGRKAAGQAALRRTPVCLLLVHAETAPPKAAVTEWSRRLQQEVLRPNEAAGKLRTELWIVVPAGGSLVPAAGEKRLSREMLANLLTSVEAAPLALPMDSAPAESASSGDAAVEEIGRRLAELQARAQWLQQEFRTAQKNPSEPPSALARPGRVTAPTTAGSAATGTTDRRDEYLRQALSLSLMLASADLVATGSSAPAGEAQQSLADLQLQCQQLLEQLRVRAGNKDVSAAKITPFPPSRA